LRVNTKKIIEKQNDTHLDSTRARQRLTKKQTGRMEKRETTRMMKKE
jgi:hypothetical protein